MLGELLPAAVVTVETRRDRVVELFAAEEDSLGRAVEKRRREFVTGRACAREALAELGFPAVPILSGTRGEPLWPAGVVGSITHCEGYRACAVGRSDEVRAIGIDAERDVRLDAGVWEEVALRSERHLAGDGLGPVLFSAKEAIYKALFELGGGSLDFADAEVAITAGAGTFDARLRPSDSPVGELSGRFGRGDGVVVTAVALPLLERPPAPGSGAILRG